VGLMLAVSTATARHVSRPKFMGLWDFLPQVVFGIQLVKSHGKCQRRVRSDRDEQLSQTRSFRRPRSKRGGYCTNRNQPALRFLIFVADFHHPLLAS
jgi:hypothetical protein